MRDGEGIRIADFEKRVRDNGLDLLFELDKCADALGPDSPRGISARALVDRVRGDMVIRPANRGFRLEKDENGAHNVPVIED